MNCETDIVQDLVCDKAKQLTCFLTVILKLRMLTSHLLTAQDMIKRVIHQPGVIQKLDNFISEQAETPSAEISKLIIAMKSHVLLPRNSMPTRVENSFDRPRPPATKDNLREDYSAEMSILQQQGKWSEFLNRKECPRCGYPPVEFAVLAPCLHIYCEQCFDELPDEDGKTDTVSRLCRICRIPISDAGYYADITSLEEVPGDSRSTTPAQSSESLVNKRKKSTREKSAKGTYKRRRKPVKISSHLLLHPGELKRETDDSSEDEMDLKSDWIPAIGCQMPNTKLDTIKKLVDGWIKEDKTVKIVIFTQFLATVTLVENLCGTKDWGFTKVDPEILNLSTRNH
jgi:hypothetical protein